MIRQNTIACRIDTGAPGIHLRNESVPFSKIYVKYHSLHARAQICHLKQAPFFGRISSSPKKTATKSETFAFIDRTLGVVPRFTMVLIAFVLRMFQCIVQNLPYIVVVVPVVEPCPYNVEPQ